MVVVVVVVAAGQDNSEGDEGGGAALAKGAGARKGACCLRWQACKACTAPSVNRRRWPPRRGKYASRPVAEDGRYRMVRKKEKKPQEKGNLVEKLIENVFIQQKVESN